MQEAGSACCYLATVEAVENSSSGLLIGVCVCVCAAACRAVACCDVACAGPFPPETSCRPWVRNWEWKWDLDRCAGPVSILTC